MAAWASAFLANWASVASRCLAWASASATRSELTASARASRWESRLTSWPRPVSRLLLPLALLPDRALAGLKAGHLVAGRGGHRGLDGREGAERGDRHGRHPGEHGHRGQTADERSLGGLATGAAGRSRRCDAREARAGAGSAWAGWPLAWARRGSRAGWTVAGDRRAGGRGHRRAAARAAAVRPVVTHRKEVLAAGLRAVVAGHTALSTQPWTSTYCNGMVTDVRNRCL